MTTRQRAARSYLFAPANNPRILAKVFTTGADAIVFDLEDAVAPAEKAAARRTLGTALSARTAGGTPPVWVRINSVGSGLWREDLAACVGPWLTGVRIPKAESTADVERVAAVIGECEEVAGMAPGSVAVTLTIESAVGVEFCRELAGCSRVSNLCFGNVDFLADIGARDAEDGLAALYAHSRVVLASRVGGLCPPVAPVHTRLDDEDRLRATTLKYRNLGFFGRSCIHPRQLAVIHEAFTPSREEVEEAREIVAAYEAALAASSGVEVTERGQFVDLAVVRRARHVIELADSLD